MTGAVEVAIRWRDDRIETVRVATHRPRLAPLLAGRSTEEAATLIETLHAICRCAQGAAARAALRAARARPEADGPATTTSYVADAARREARPA